MVEESQGRTHMSPFVFFPTLFSAVHSIWEHLDALARYEGTTVLITTHYVEEARQADTVGQSVTVHSKLKGLRP
jgi:hypothetical protein